MAVGDEEVASTDTKCLIKIAANSKIMAASLSAQVEKFDKYVEEERETHRLLDAALAKMNDTIHQVNSRMNRLLISSLTFLVVTLAGTSAALIVYIFTSYHGAP